MRWALVGLFVFVACVWHVTPSHAAEADLYCQTGTSSTGAPIFNPVGSTNPCPFSSIVGTTNGWTPLLDNAQSTTVKAVKSSAGQLGMLQCYNPNSSQVYVQVFNIASGSVTLGSSTPTLSVPIAPTATGGYALSNPGINFSTAISLAVTTTATGSTAPSTAADCNVAYN